MSDKIDFLLLFCNSRLTNLIHKKNISDEDMWKIIKGIKSDISFEKDCGDGTTGMYEEEVQRAQVSLVEQHLKMQSSDVTLETMTGNALQTAAEMFIYLNTCPNILKPWYVFYTDLIKYQSPDQIALTLNRLMKVSPTSENKHLVNIAKDLFMKVTEVLSFKLKEVKKITKGSGNSSFAKDLSDLKGVCF